LGTSRLDGDPWFVAADVCRVIGYALSPLDKTEITTRRMSGKRGASPKLISESGLAQDFSPD